MNIAILGTGLIGIDLAAKVKRSSALECRLIAGRSSASNGFKEAIEMGHPTSAGGVSAVLDCEHPLAMVFDATNATSHLEHAELLRPLGIRMVDLTPSKIGHMIVPTINGLDALDHGDVNLISCGGQASIPILHAIAARYPMQYIEAVTTAATKSVGRATRINVDEYVQTTADAIRAFTGTAHVKACLNVSPARPPATFRVAMTMLAQGVEVEVVRAIVAAAAAKVRSFAPGYRVCACTVEGDQIFITVEVESAGDRIPRHGGNLDIINSAAILLAEQFAADRFAAQRRAVS